jgi:HSP20 family protein
MRGPWRDPIGGHEGFQEMVNRLVDESLTRLGDYWPGKDGDVKPRADQYETETEVRIHVEVPGMRRDEISLSMTGRTLSLWGEKKRPEHEDEKLLVQGERAFGAFRRNFMFKFDVPADGVSAILADGVLVVTILKSTERAQRIDIKVG